jgi:hypothetical protein
MQVQSSGPLAEFGQRFSDYLPTLAAGLVVLGLGLVAGWVAKRVVVRVLIWLRLDRLGGRVAWRAAFGKGDVRAALYNLLGTVAMVLVILVFLDNALQIWGLTVLSRMIEGGITYMPNLGVAAVIVTVGFLLANTAAHRVEDALEEEDAPYAKIAARILKAALLAIVTALALWQLDFAREIVLAAFLIGFGAVGLAFAVGVGVGSARAIQRGWEIFFEKKKGE